MKKLAALLLLMCLLSSNSLHAGAGVSRVPASVGQDLIDRYRGRIQETLNDVRSMQPDCPDCGLYNEGNDDEDVGSTACRQTYQRIFKIKQSAQDEPKSAKTIDVRIAFGYMDFLDSTEDRYASYAYAAELLAPCKAGGFACGFTQSPDDAEVFTKHLRILGPDGEPRDRTVNVRIRCSSVTDDERVNRGDRADDQKAQSASTTKFYSDALQNSDVVFYVGHARDGGGPDFSPPVVNEKTRHTDYNWYHIHHPGMDMVTDALSDPAHQPKVMGLFACYAQDHFGDSLKTMAPHTGLILSGQQEFEASVGQASAALDSIMGLRCADQFNRAVDVLKNVNSTVIAPVHLDNMF